MKTTRQGGSRPAIGSRRVVNSYIRRTNVMPPDVQNSSRHASAVSPGEIRFSGGSCFLFMAVYRTPAAGRILDLTFNRVWDMLVAIPGTGLEGNLLSDPTCYNHFFRRIMDIPKILIVDDEEDVRNAYLSILTPQAETDDIDEIAASLFNEDDSSEDEPDDISAFFEDDGAEMIVEEELQTGTYQVEEASQGDEAVRMIRAALQENRPYSLMFLDIRMPPGIDGVQAAKEIRAIDPNVEIVIMTAYSDYSYEEIIQTVGNPDRLLYFHKPFKSSQILQLASTLTQQWYLERKVREAD